ALTSASRALMAALFPCATSSTVPSGRFRTNPVTGCRLASDCAVYRNPTPCTRPLNITRSVVMSHMLKIPVSAAANPTEPAPLIRLLAYSPEKYIERDIADPQELRAFLGHWHVCWVDVDGLGDARTLEQIAAIFHLHSLAMEDVVNVHQRAKVDTFGERTFMV